MQDFAVRWMMVEDGRAPAEVRSWSAFGEETSGALDDLREGLSRAQMELSPKYFYDEVGSRLFEAITELPEYYLTRTERSLLERWMRDWMSEIRPRSLVELGAGSARKTRIVIDAIVAAGSAERYLPVDISDDFLADTAQEIEGEYPGLRVEPVVADISKDFELPSTLPSPVVFAFLGSTIGNFDGAGAVELLRVISSAMHAPDRLLLGADLRKDPATLEAAYNDSQGTTAEFNLNSLRVINERFGANFDLNRFRHRAGYNQKDHRIEMHLVSTAPQRITIPGAGTFSIDEGETIRTEISSKYDRATLESLLRRAGLSVERWATDPEDRFAILLAKPS